MRALVIGKNGQISRALGRLQSAELEFLSVGRPELDLTDKTSILRAIDRYKPDCIVNPAAYTLVDQAELEVGRAFLTNRDGARNVGEAANKFSLPLIHISTDYVFNGAIDRAYKEDDPTGPINVYGLSKLEGEWAVAQAHSDHIILRTAWVYSGYGSNFLTTMLRAAQRARSLRVVSDQWGTPTHAHFLAMSINVIVERVLKQSVSENWRGIFHLVPDGFTNWAEFASVIFRSQLSTKGTAAPLVIPIPSADYRAVAKRPPFATLDNSKVKATFGLTVKHWTSYLI